MSIIDFFDDDDDRAIKVHDTNGIRHGSFEIHGIKGHFPIVVITSTNLNHLKDAKKLNFDFDFKVNIIEIIEFDLAKLLIDSAYEKRQIKKISKIITNNPNKLFLFTIKGARGDFKLTEQVNEFLIDFQIKCGFALIRVFFTYARKAWETYQKLRKLIPKNASFVACLDEDLPEHIFKLLYLNCYAKKDPIISFIGREPSKQNGKNVDNKTNFQFILKRKNDKILRLTSFIPKAFNDISSPFVYHLFGFDAYSLMTRQGNQNISKVDIKAIHKFKYKLLFPNTKLVCALTGQNLYTSSQMFKTKIKKSSLPVSVHAIAELNKIFETLPKNYTREKLEKIVGKNFYRLSS
jgi:hypothetical protein